MRKLLVCLLVLVSISALAQKKKVTVVTFYANKMVEFDDLGAGYDFLLQDILKLRDDPKFNLAPLLEQYHNNFFNDYSKEFPFDLVPEAEVFNNDTYQNFIPKYDVKDYDAANYLVYDKYKYIYEGFMGKDNEQALAKMFTDKSDGVLFVNVNFAFEKGFGVGSTATIKMRATTRVALYDKNGNKVFAFTENERSKKTGVMVGGVPIVKPEKILPMCESALTELMGDLKKRISKIVKRSEVML
ncbi:hypothetical protein [Flavobacterium limnosediminis]|nr:hypothetical protein [Flavobacterium limnosediminis]